LPKIYPRGYPAGMNTTALTSKSRAYLPSLLLLVLSVVSVQQWWSTSDELALAKESTINLTGTVKLDSLPLESGVLELTRADGQLISVPITNGTFRLSSIPAGDWQQSIRGPGVPNLYQDAGTITIDARIRSFQFGLKGTEQLERYTLSLLERAKD
jgi:hypothetical protein